MSWTWRDGVARMKSAAQAPAFAPARTWAEHCASFCYRISGRQRNGYDPALAALHAARIISTDPAAAVAGCFHYWDGTPFGHVAMAVPRRLASRAPRAAMASTWVAPGNGHADVWHTNAGAVDIEAYTAAHPALRYRGWAMSYGDTVLDGVIVAVKVPGRPEVWRIMPDLTRRHLTKPQWAALKLRGVRAKRTTAAALAQFPVSA